MFPLKLVSAAAFVEEKDELEWRIAVVVDPEWNAGRYRKDIPLFEVVVRLGASRESESNDTPP